MYIETLKNLDARKEKDWTRVSAQEFVDKNMERDLKFGSLSFIRSLTYLSTINKIDDLFKPNKNNEQIKYLFICETSCLKDPSNKFRY